MNLDEHFKITKIVPSVDWLSGTVKEEGRRDDVATIAHNYLNAQLALGYEASVWKSFHYEGWRINGASWGRRTDDDIVTFTGDTAIGNWKPLSKLLETCSRLDLAVTVWQANHDIARASREYQAIQQLAQVEAITRKYTFITNLLGGDTLYVGSRNSQYFGRLYDKGLQSQELHYANSWRWEVELHKPAALMMLRRMSDCDQLEDFIITQVKTWFEDRYVKCPFEPNAPQTTVDVPRRKKTSDEQSLEWLDTGVKKTVQKLAKKGKVREVLKALGLEEYADDVFRKKSNPRD